MRIPVSKISQFDGKTCFICGKYLLNNTADDLAYQHLPNGKSIKAMPDKYYLFSCPNCGKVAHKRCWYDIGEQKQKKGWFGKKEWKLICPGCKQQLSSTRSERSDWKKGYQIPSHPDDELLELHVPDVMAWKAGSIFGKIGKAIDNFFQAVGLGSLSESETSAISVAAAKIGKTLRDIAQKVFRLEIPPERRKEIKELRCQNCGAPLPMPEPYVEAVICAHCNTAHLLPT
ncbi:MAG: hypothetical protein EAX95_15940 [Candidatus Thorarchaeota archaeon]|nr:hypothetical protein [Candidatus Thorarchaeota archaeon]